MTEEVSLFDRLSPEKQAEAMQDFAVYGRVVIHERPDGVELLHPFRTHTVTEADFKAAFPAAEK